MKSRRFTEVYWIVIVAGLLLLTALGNAMAMFIAAAIALPLSLVIIGKRFAGAAVLVAAASCAVAALVAWTWH